MARPADRRWSEFEAFLWRRSQAVAAISADLDHAVERAAGAEVAAVKALDETLASALSQARFAAETAAGVLTLDANRRLLGARLDSSAGRHAALAAPADLDIAPRGTRPDGMVRLGELAQSTASRPRTGPYDPRSLSQLPLAVRIAGRNLVARGRADGLADDLIRMLLLWLVLGHAPGELRLVLVDPRGAGQGLAAFLALPPAIRGDKVLVGPEEIEVALKGVSSTVEGILQLRLGSRYESLEAYNAANPAIAEPRRIVAVLGFPGGGWTDRSIDFLGRIARNGPKAGMHVVASLDDAAPRPRSLDIDQLFEGAIEATVESRGTGRVVVPGRPEVAYHPDAMPAPARVERLLEEVEAAFATRSRALPAAGILPDLTWGESSADGVSAPIGLDADGELLSIALGDDPAHGLIGGMTGMGKSNLLHMVVVGLTSRYGPDELEFDILDFREGVEFAPYRRLPHARAVALETEREFALSVLRALQDEIKRRGRLFPEGVGQFPAYRATGRSLPRRILLIDEFQVLLAGDDPIARDAAAVLEDLVKRGRGFGVHVLLSSQSPAVAGPYLTRIYNQMGLRMALRCRPADALAILGEGNDAAATLEERGEVVVNAELGRPAGNRRVRVALLERDALIARIDAMAKRDAGRSPAPVTFSGSAPARLELNPCLLGLGSGTWQPPRNAVELFLGEPVELKGPTSAVAERYPRANLLVAGADEESAYGLLVSAVASAALEDEHATFHVIELARPSSPVAGVFRRLAALLPDRMTVVGERDAGAKLAELAATIAERAGGAQPSSATAHLVVTGLHRWRDLRGATAFDTTELAAQLTRLLDEGPENGLHTIAWTDSFAALERALRRGGAGLFDLRAVLRVPEQDSQNLLESVAASRLADNRALFRSQDWPAGRTEKFKPYPVPDATALAALLGT